LERDPDKTDNTEYVLNDDRKAWRWARVKVGEQYVCFRLIFGGNGPDAVEPFYVMESKVWTSLYREAGMIPPAESEVNGPESPVTGVTAEEAARFAKVALDGTLPTPKQWDHAAGVGVARRDTVTRGGGRPRVNIARPGPLSRDDVSEFGLLDMAGNGREWTRGVLSSAKLVGVDAISPTDLVILRGRNFTLQSGLTFKDLEYEQHTPQTHLPTARSPYTSFRVVVPVP
jgi:formylglycine-generating enzyme required for sulfatase activity